MDGTSSGGGHRIVRTVFVECGAAYDHAAPEHLMSVGETSFVAGESARDPAHLIGGIVSSADLRRPDLDEILDAHAEAGGHLFKGIRHALSSAEHPEALRIPGRAPRDLATDPSFRRGVGRLGDRGLTYDTWHYHYQNGDFRLAAGSPMPNTGRSSRNSRDSTRPRSVSTSAWTRSRISLQRTSRKCST